MAGLINLEEFADYVATHPNATYREMAEAFGVSRQAVQQRYKKIGLEDGRKRRFDVSDDELLSFARMHKELSMEKIALHFGIPRSTVQSRLHSMGFFRFRINKVTENDVRDYWLSHPDSTKGECADALGCSGQFVSNALERLGLASKKSSSIVDVERFKSVLKNNPKISNKALAEMFDCSIYTVSSIKSRLKKPKSLAPTNHYRRLSWEDFKKILDEEPNISVVSLARRVGCNASTANRYLRKYGFLRGHKRKVDKELLRSIFLDPNDLRTTQELADAFGVCKAAIYNIKNALSKSDKAVADACNKKREMRWVSNLAKG